MKLRKTELFPNSDITLILSGTVKKKCGMFHIEPLSPVDLFRTGSVSKIGLLKQIFSPHVRQ